MLSANVTTMTNVTGQQDPPSTVVFRPRRRCPKCGLVNTDLAPRCRRCRRLFDDIDPRVESERLVERLRARRIIAIVCTVVIATGLLATGYGYWARQQRLERFEDSSTRILLDLETTERGSIEDAYVIASAFDDAEVVRLLSDQAATWSDRKRRCESLRQDVNELVPQNPQQTAAELAIEHRLDALAQASSALAGAATMSDPATGRKAAERYVADSASLEQ